jgi:truncated hemoglobin YjbI
MPKPEKSISAMTQSDAPDGLTEQEVRAWLETFHAAQVREADIARRLANRAAFWKD